LNKFLKTNNKMRFIPLLLTLLLIFLTAVPSIILAAANVDLLTVDSLAILGATTVTNACTSVVNGNLGLSPGLSVTGIPPGTLNGTQYVNEAVSIQAQSDLITASNNVAGRGPVTSTLLEYIGGKNLALTLPGRPPHINIVETPNPLALPSGQGMVTYTYKITNPGMAELSNVSVIDNKVSPVNYVSGDVNADNLLQPNETWIYTSKMNLKATTSSTATAKGSANGMTTTSIVFVTVVVTQPEVDTKTVTGGQLPKTATPFYNILIAGTVLTIIGAVGLKIKKIYE
jgi:hypothetical protein